MGENSQKSLSLEMLLEGWKEAAGAEAKAKASHSRSSGPSAGPEDLVGLEPPLASPRALPAARLSDSFTNIDGSQVFPTHNKSRLH